MISRARPLTSPAARYFLEAAPDWRSLRPTVTEGVTSPFRPPTAKRKCSPLEKARLGRQRWRRSGRRRVRRARAARLHAERRAAHGAAGRTRPADQDGQTRYRRLSHAAVDSNRPRLGCAPPMLEMPAARPPVATTPPAAVAPAHRGANGHRRHLAASPSADPSRPRPAWGHGPLLPRAAESADSQDPEPPPPCVPGGPVEYDPRLPRPSPSARWARPLRSSSLPVCAGRLRQCRHQGSDAINGAAAERSAATPRRDSDSDPVIRIRPLPSSRSLRTGQSPHSTRQSRLVIF